MKSIRLKTSIGSSIAAVLCCVVMASTLSGCTVKQQTDTKAVIAKISAYEPELAVAVDTLSLTVAVFLPADAALITALDATFDANVAELKTLCDSYTATPNAGTLASIQTALSNLLNTNATQFLAAAHITNPTSVATAKLAIGAVRTVLLLMQGALQTVETPAQSAAAAQSQSQTLKLSEVAPYLDKHKVGAATGVPFRVAVHYEESQGF